MNEKNSDDSTKYVPIRDLKVEPEAEELLGSAAMEPYMNLAAALMGGVFYGLAAGNHVLQPHRSRLQNIAMVTDVFAAVVLLVSFGGLIR